MHAWREELRGRGAWLAVALAACLLSADLWLPGAQRATGASGALVVAGAVLAVALPLVYASVERPLRTRVMGWLGSRSFSLYLVHHPIVLAFAYGLDVPALPVLLALVLPTSLLAAEAFFRAVERPCHGLARAVTAQLSARAAAADAARAAAAAPGAPAVRPS